jgi:hypothetical protein
MSTPQEQLTPQPEDVPTFANRIRQKTHAYSDVDDHELVTRIVKKFPEYAEHVQMNPTGAASVRDDVDFSNEPQPTPDAPVMPASIERGAMLDPSRRYTLKLPVDAADDGDTILQKGLASVGQNLGLTPEQITHATSTIYQTLKQKGRGLSYAGTNQPTTQKAVDEAKRTGQVSYVLEDPEIISRFNDYLASSNSMQAATPQEKEVLNASSDTANDARRVGLNPRDLQLVAGAGEAAGSDVMQLGANAADVIGANSLRDKLQGAADLHLQKGQAIDERRDELEPRSLGETVISEAVKSAPQMAMLGGVGEGGAMAARLAGAPALVGSTAALAGMGALQNERGGAKEMVKGAGMNALLPVVGSALSARALNLGVPQRLMGEFTLNAAPAYLATGDTDKAIAQGLIAVGMHKAGGEGVEESSVVPETARPKFVVRRDGLIDVHVPDESGNGHTVVTVMPDAPSRVEASRSLSQRMAMKTATRMRENLERLESGKMSRGEVAGLSEYNGVTSPQALGQFYRDQIKGLETHARGRAPVPVSEKLREHFPDIPVETPSMRPIDRTPAGQIKDNIYAALSLPRSIITAGDLSASGRQGAALAAGHPVKAARAFGAQLRAFASEGQARAEMERIQNHPLFDVAKESGLFLPDLEDSSLSVGQREEAYASKFAKHVPLVKRSERAFNTFLNKLRFDVFTDAVKAHPEMSEKDMHSLSNTLNVLTGRGHLPTEFLERHAAEAAQIIFAPRLLASRFESLTLPFRGSAVARREAARSLVSLVGVNVGLLGLAKMAGAKVDTDPRSTDFARIRIGNTRLDFAAGYQPLIRYTAQLLMGQRKDVETGEIRKAARLDIAEHLARTRAAPQVSTPIDLATGKNVAGEPVTLKSAALGSVEYLALRDIEEAVKDDLKHGRSGRRGAALGSLAIFGVGASTYDSEKKPKTQLQFKRR